MSLLLELRSTAPVPTTFDPAKIADGGVFASLSNGNLTATGISGTSGDFGNVGATSSKAAGKVTYSFSFDSCATGADTAFGFSDATFNWAGIVQFSGSAHAVSWRVFGSGSSAEQFWNGSTFIDLTTINGGGWSLAQGGAGHEHQIIIDIPNLLVYLAIDGSPVFGMNPAAGTGGISIAISAPFTPGLSHGDVNVATLDPTPAFLPTGFSTWDAASGTAYNDNLSETAAAADSSATAETFASTDAEASTAAATVTATQTFVNADSEAVSAVDSVSGGLLLGGSLNESAVAADGSTTSVIWRPAQVESAAAADSAASQAIDASIDAESAAATDSAASSAAMPNALGETAGAADQATSSQVFSEALGENAAASDSASADGTTTFNEAVNESLAPAMSATVGLSLSAAATESAAAVDQAAGADTASAGVVEQAGAADSAAAAEVASESIDEAASAGDSFDGIDSEAFPPTRPSSRSAHIVRLGRNAAVARGRRSSVVTRARRVA